MSTDPSGSVSQDGMATVLHHGSVMSVDAERSVHSAMIVREGRIAALGSDEKMRALAPSGSRDVDLGGRTVVPGFIDGHAHISGKGLPRLLPDLSSCRSSADIVAEIRIHVARSRPGEWVVTGPIGTPPLFDDVRDWLDRGDVPSRWDLDAVSPDNPVYIKPALSNRPPLVAVVNSKALQALGVDRSTQTSFGITIGVDGSGEPDGRIREDDSSGLLNTPSLELSLLAGAPHFTVADRVASLPLSLQDFHAGGTTSVFEGHGLAPHSARALKELHWAGQLTMRVNAVLSPPFGESVGDFERNLRDWASAVSGPGCGDDFLRFGGIFLSFEGDPARARLNATAAPYTAYGDGYTDGMDLAEYRAKAYAAARQDVRVATIAANGVDLGHALDVWEEIAKEYPLGERRWVLQHLYDVSPDDTRRMRDLGVLATGLPTSQFWRGASPRTLKVPEQRRGFVGAYRTMGELLCLSMGTDGAPARPMLSLDAVTTRRARDGVVIAADQALDLDSALETLTRNGAHLSFEEGVKGSLAVGKYADFVVLGDDLRSVRPGDYSSVEIHATVVGGRVVHGNLE